jgi:DNA-binding CsgD family transcriptional regulator
MERLRQKDIRQLLEFTRRVYASRNRDEFGQCVVAHLSGVVGCQWSSYDEMVPAARISMNVFHPSVIRAPDAWTALMHEHPMLAHYLRTGDGRASQIADFLAPAAFRRGALYNEVYRPTGVDNEIVLVLDVPLPSVVGFGLARARRPFDARERLLLNLARPHLLQAYENARAFSSMSDAPLTFGRTHGVVERRIVRLAPDGRIGSADEPAGDWIDTCFGKRREQGRRLPDALERWIRRFDLPRMSKLDDAPRHFEPLVFVAHGVRLMIRMVPDAQQRLLILERQVVTETTPRGSRLLTARERDVMQWVSEGKSNGEVGLILGCSSRTVQKHLENVYSKLGVHNRTAAVVALKEFPDGSKGST